MMPGAMSWLSVYILTFNCARNPLNTDVFASCLFDGLPSSGSAAGSFPDILVLSLQEVAPLSHSFLGGSLLEPYYEPFRRAVNQATKDGQYENVITRNVGMTAIMVFVRDDVADRVSWIETAEVGVGIQEAGNKGAVGARLGYLVDRDGQDTVDLTFVAAHLAPHEFAWKKRNEDWRSISQQLVFTRSDATTTPARRVEDQDEEGVPLLDDQSSAGRGHSSIYAPDAYLFVAGDLNYRTSDQRPAENDYLKFPRSTDDENNPRHWTHLLVGDQLTRERHAHRTLQNLKEHPVAFPPTYKYYHGSPPLDPEGEWNWASHRWPSWCDRILYLDGTSDDDDSHHIRPQKYDALPLLPTSDHRPVALSVSVPLKAHPQPAADLSSVFEMDPDWESKRVAARRKEILAGIIAYGLFTWQGNAIILATFLAVSAGYVALRTYLPV